MITTSKVILLSAFLLSVVTQLWCAPIPIIAIGKRLHAGETDSSSSSEVPENDKYNMGHPRVPTTHLFNDLETKTTIRNEVSYEPHRGQMFTPNVGSSHWTNDYKLGMRTMNKLFEEGERFDQKINYLIEKKNAYLNGKNSFKVFMIKDIGPDSNLVSNIDTHDRLDSEQNVKNITDNGKILTERIFSLPFKSDISKSFDNIGPGNVFHMSQALDHGNRVLKGLLDEIKYGNILSKADPIDLEDPYRDTILETPIHKKIRTNDMQSSSMKGHSDNFIDINVKDIGNLHESRGQSKFLIDDSDLSQGFGNDEDGEEDSGDADSKASQSGADASSEAGSKIVSAEATKEDENEDDSGEEESEESSETEKEREKKAAENSNESGEDESDEEIGDEEDDDPMRIALGEPELGMGVVDEEGEDNNGSDSSDGDYEDDDNDDDDNGNGNGDDNCVNSKCENGYNGNKNEDAGGFESDDDDVYQNGNGSIDDGAGETEDDNGEDNGDDEEEEDEDESEEEEQEDEEEGEGAMSNSKVGKNTTVTIRLINNSKNGKKSTSAKSLNGKDSENGEKSHKVHKVRIKTKIHGHNGKEGMSKSKHKKIKVAVKIKDGKKAEENGKEERESEEEEDDEDEGSNGDDSGGDDSSDESDEDNGDEEENGDDNGGDDNGDESGHEENGDGDDDEEEEGDDDDDDDDEDNGEDDDNDDEDDDEEEEEEEEEEEGEEDEGETAGGGNNGNGKCKTMKIKSGTKIICTSDDDISLPTVNNQDDSDNGNRGEKLTMVNTEKHMKKGKEKKGTWFARKKMKSKELKRKSLATIKVHHTKKGNRHHILIKQKTTRTKTHGKKHSRKHGKNLNATSKPSRKEDESREMNKKTSPFEKDIAEIMKPLFMTNITITNSSVGKRNGLGSDEINESAGSAKNEYLKQQSTKSPSPLTSYKIAGEKPPLKITMNISEQPDASTQGEGEGIEKEFNPTEIDSFIKQLKSVYDDDDDFIMFLLKLLRKELKSRLSKN